jgi:hypothetical protein
VIYVIFFARDDELAASQAPPRSNERAVSLRSQVPVIAMCIAGLFVPLLIPLVTRRVLTLADLADLHLPLRYLYWSALERGDSVLWTSALFSGFDLHGEGQVGMAHPFHFLIYRLLPLDIAYNIELIANYVGAVAGMRLLLPRFGLSREGAWFGAMVFAFSGFNLLHLMHLNVIGIMSHAPWMLLATHVLMTSPDRRARAAAFAGVALLLASQVFLGHHQFVWMTLLATACLALWLAFVEGLPSRLLPLSGAIVCGVLISAVQLLPTLDSLNGSNRAAPSFDFRMTYSMKPVTLIQWVSPYLHGFGAFGNREEFSDFHEFSWYDGAFAVLAVAWVAIRRHALLHYRFVTVALVFAALSVILSLGRYGGLYGWLSEFPILDKFRAPGRHVVLFHLALSGIAAAVFDDLVGLIRRGEKFPARRCRLFALIACVSVGTVVFYASGDGLAVSDVVVAGAWSGIMAATALLLVLAASGQRWAIPALVILAAIDLGGWGYRYIYRGRPEAISDIAARAAIPPDARPGELINPVETHNPSRNLAVLRDMRVWEAYVGLPPAAVLLRNDVTALRLAGVAWRASGNGWTRVPDPMPRARLVASARRSERVESEILDIDPARVALLDRPMDDLSGVPGSARILVDRPGRIDVETSAPGKQLLVLTERFHAGWQATADGRELETLSVYGTHLGGVVNPGTSRIQFVFAPPSLTVGIAVTLGGLVLTVAIAGFIGWKPRSRAES